MSETAVAGRSADVLVVDDERAVCESVEKVLARQGYRVAKATSVAAAVELLAGGSRCDLIVADLMMPQSSGVELVRIVRQRWPEVAILIMTGYASIASAVETARLGAVGYLPKPFTPDELARAVDDAIRVGGEGVLRFEQLLPSGPIDVDLPFDGREVARATSNAYVEHLTRSDMPLVEPAAPSATPDYCALGQRSCKRVLKKGVCRQPECPVVVAERRKAARNAAVAAVISDPIDIDMPFSASEVAASTSDSYVAALGRSDLPVVGHWHIERLSGAPRVLVVDDEAVVLNSVRRSLSRRGFLVDESFSGREALRRLAGATYDLVLLDMRLPDANGLELLSKIRVARPGLRVVIVTGFASIDTAVEAIRRGASDFLPKPFTPDELVELTERVLERAA